MYVPMYNGNCIFRLLSLLFERYYEFFFFHFRLNYSKFLKIEDFRNVKLMKLRISNFLFVDFQTFASHSNNILPRNAQYFYSQVEHLAQLWFRKNSNLTDKRVSFQTFSSNKKDMDTKYCVSHSDFEFFKIETQEAAEN